MSDNKQPGRPKHGWTAPTIEDDPDTHKAGGRDSKDDGGPRFVKRRDGVSAVRKGGPGPSVETKMVMHVPTMKAGRNGTDSELSAQAAKSLVETTREVRHRMIKAHREGRISDQAMAACENLFREIEKMVGQEIRRRR